ncbi:methyltransferase domain-containing protein [Chloroflexi bacterium TSY]|nr:methyltransferase domain-containing protein [Chloroflexi bacterium TSY]
MASTNYAPPSHWDEHFAGRYRNGKDLDWGTQWTGEFLEPLTKADANIVLDLGCGSGNDMMRLADAGFRVVGLDYSRVAIAHAAKKARSRCQFVVGDMAQGLPFSDFAFDAIMSNVAAHMFPDTVTRSLFHEIHRILSVDGLFLFHVNAVEDRPLRPLRWPPLRELEPNYVLEQHGQTMHFFSEEYLQELLASWSNIELELVEITSYETGEPFKRVWRGIAKK